MSADPDLAKLPAPLVPPEVDLRGLLFMPLDVQRLLDSDFYAKSSGDEFKAGLTLWCKAFHQTPAGSLPDDDEVLAKLVGAQPRRWRKLRAVALRGWFRCSDGRLYHHVVAEKALQTWKTRTAQRDRARKRVWPDAPAQPRHSPGTATAHVTTIPGQTHGITTAVPGHSRGNAKGVEWTGVEGSGVEVPPPSPAASPQSSSSEHARTREGSGGDGNGEEKKFQGETAPSGNGEIELLDSGEWRGVSEEQRLKWQGMFDTLSIPDQLDRAAQWLLSKPEKRSNYSSVEGGMRSYIVNWLLRESRGAPPPPTKH